MATDDCHLKVSGRRRCSSLHQAAWHGLSGALRSRKPAGSCSRNLDTCQQRRVSYWCFQGPWRFTMGKRSRCHLELWSTAIDTVTKEERWHIAPLHCSWLSKHFRIGFCVAKGRPRMRHITSGRTVDSGSLQRRQVTRGQSASKREFIRSFAWSFPFNTNVWIFIMLAYRNNFVYGLEARPGDSALRPHRGLTCANFTPLFRTMSSLLTAQETQQFW